MYTHDNVTDVANTQIPWSVDFLFTTQAPHVVSGRWRFETQFLDLERKNYKDYVNELVCDKCSTLRYKVTGNVTTT